MQHMQDEITDRDATASVFFRFFKVVQRTVSRGSVVEMAFSFVKRAV